LIKKKDKRAGGVTQVVEHLFSKCEALSLNPISAKKTKRKKEKRKGGREGERKKKDKKLCVRYVEE
jgi:hypothetical protein